MKNKSRKTFCLFKRKTIIVLFLCLLMSFVFLVKQRSDKPDKLVWTDGPVDNFSLMDHQGVFHEFYNYSDQKAIVLLVQANGCSVNRLMAKYLNQLKEKYEPSGVQFLMINASSKDDRESIAKEAEKYNISIPVLKDEAQVISFDLKIQQAGEAIIFNPLDWSIVYRGAIGQEAISKTTEKEIEDHYVRDVLDALIKEEPVVVSRTQTEGCMVNMNSISAQKEISYVEDVAPILIDRCLSCHNEGRNDTWAMSDYKEVVSWGPLVRESIRTKRMPPWKGDESLSPDEIRKLVLWIEQGALRGEGADPLKSYLEL